MMRKWLVMVIGPSYLPHPREVLMGVNGLLSARFPYSLHMDNFFFSSSLTVGRNERLSKRRNY